MQRDTALAKASALQAQVNDIEGELLNEDEYQAKRVAYLIERAQPEEELLCNLPYLLALKQEFDKQIDGALQRIIDANIM